ncbi:hypothetical protein D3C73_1193480 [compost metagenome]
MAGLSLAAVSAMASAYAVFFALTSDRAEAAAALSLLRLISSRAAAFRFPALRAAEICLLSEVYSSNSGACFFFMASASVFSRFSEPASTAFSFRLIALRSALFCLRRVCVLALSDFNAVCRPV